MGLNGVLEQPCLSRQALLVNVFSRMPRRFTSMLSDPLKTKIRSAYGSLSQSLPGFAKRPQQNQLIAEISKVLAGHYDRQRRILLAEAGTGTGKSLAYLLAAIPLAQAFNKKLIISTATVALQEQLVEKDLPLLANHSGLRFEFQLAKGRQRYCCEHKLEALQEYPDPPPQGPATLTPAQRHQLAELRQAYLAGDWQGDRDSWPDAIDSSLWQRIMADRHSCHSALKRHQHCPFQRARRQACYWRIWTPAAACWPSRPTVFTC